MILEFCAENFDLVPEAIEQGIHRIELCDALDVGGTTPASEVQKETVDYAHMRGVEVVCMIRPRGGNFIYTDEEKERMIKQAQEAVENGVDGLVFGCLTEEGQLDKPILEELISVEIFIKKSPFMWNHRRKILPSLSKIYSDNDFPPV